MPQDAKMSFGPTSGHPRVASQGTKHSQRKKYQQNWLVKKIQQGYLLYPRMLKCHLDPPQGILGQLPWVTLAISKIGSHLFAQLVKCFLKWYDTTHQHQQRWRRYISSIWPNQRPGQDCTASARGPIKKLQIIKKFLEFVFRGVSSIKKWPIIKKVTTPFEVCACVTLNCGSRAKIKNLLTLVCLPYQILS